MRTTIEHGGHTVTLDNGQYSIKHPKPSKFIEVPEWDGTNGQRLEIVPPLDLAGGTATELLGSMAAEQNINLIDVQQSPPDESSDGVTLLKVDPARNMPGPVHQLLAFGVKAVDTFGQAQS